ncbi:MAG: DUF2062 domain-containing protein [Candidatus Wallbacteria bacterium]|nr:DUF2062 domain-containing protein [Candidatus Wallbacteria bacterium]
MNRFEKIFRSGRNKVIRILKSGNSPHEIALSFTVGVFFACLPLYGVHTMLALVAAACFKLNPLLALAGVYVNNPLTVPLISVLSIGLGKWLVSVLPVGFFPPDSHVTSMENAMVLFRELMMGSVVLGLVSALLTYPLVFWLTRIFLARSKEHNENLSE